MKFTITKGVNPDADIIPMNLRGKIIDNRTASEKEATYKLISKCPRLMGKKDKQ